MQIYHKFFASLQISRGAAYAPFNLLGIQMLHQHGYPVTLPGHLHRFPEHLHRFYFVFLLQLTQLYLLPRFDPTLHNRPSYDRPLTLDLKTMVDQVQKFVLYVSVGNGNLVQQDPLQVIVVVFLLTFGGKWDYNQIGPKFGLPKHLSQCPYLPLQNLLILHHIHLV